MGIKFDLSPEMRRDGLSEVDERTMDSVRKSISDYFVKQR